MSRVTVDLVRAFTAPNVESGGNLAGVVVDGSGLSKAAMQAVAREVGYSETAFISVSTRAERRIRFFTPNGEVDLCGHATVAVYGLLHLRGLIGVGHSTHELKAGVLEVAVEADGTIVMEMAQPVFGDTVPTELVGSILRIPPEWIGVTGNRPQVVSTGLPDVCVPIDTREHLLSIEPDFTRMAAYSRATNTIGFHVFTRDTVNTTATAHCRNFAPACDIPEEPATGSASGALAVYLNRYHGLSGTMVFEQGYSMGSPSEIIVEVQQAQGRLTGVSVKGRAVFVGQRVIEVE